MSICYLIYCKNCNNNISWLPCSEVGFEAVYSEKLKNCFTKSITRIDKFDVFNEKIKITGAFCSICRNYLGYYHDENSKYFPKKYELPNFLINFKYFSNKRKNYSKFFQVQTKYEFFEKEEKIEENQIFNTNLGKFSNRINKLILSYFNFI